MTEFNFSFWNRTNEKKEIENKSNRKSFIPSPFSLSVDQCSIVNTIVTITRLIACLLGSRDEANELHITQASATFAFYIVLDFYQSRE